MYFLSSGVKGLISYIPHAYAKHYTWLQRRLSLGSTRNHLSPNSLRPTEDKLPIPSAETNLHRGLPNGDEGWLLAPDDRTCLSSSPGLSAYYWISAGKTSSENLTSWNSGISPCQARKLNGPECEGEQIGIKLTISPSYVKHSSKTLSMKTLVSVPKPYLQKNVKECPWKNISLHKEYCRVLVVDKSTTFTTCCYPSKCDYYLASSSLLSMPLWSVSRFKYCPTPKE